jgi:hypothetical protein
MKHNVFAKMPVETMEGIGIHGSVPKVPRPVRALKGDPRVAASFTFRQNFGNNSASSASEARSQSFVATLQLMFQVSRTFDRMTRSQSSNPGLKSSSMKVSTFSSGLFCTLCLSERSPHSLQTRTRVAPVSLKIGSPQVCGVILRELSVPRHAHSHQARGQCGRLCTNSSLFEDPHGEQGE